MRISAIFQGSPMEVFVDPWNVDIAVQTFMEMGAIAVSVSEEEK